MSNVLRLLIAAVVVTATLAAATIQFDVDNVGIVVSGETRYRYTYVVTDVTLQANQELDIRFDPSLYGMLLNPTAPSGFDLQLFQPNNPPGAAGDYSAFAMVDNPSLSGQFSVDFTFLGQGAPGAQEFLINQYDEAGNLIAVVDSGLTAPATPAAVPEPASLTLGGLGLLAGVWLSARRRSSKQTV